MVVNVGEAEGAPVPDVEDGMAVIVRVVVTIKIEVELELGEHGV